MYGPQEYPPADPKPDPGQEREPDVAEVELEAILPERRLEGRVAEPQAETREALPHGTVVGLRVCGIASIIESWVLQDLGWWSWKS